MSSTYSNSSHRSSTAVRRTSIEIVAEKQAATTVSGFGATRYTCTLVLLIRQWHRVRALAIARRIAASGRNRREAARDDAYSYALREAPER